MSKHIPELIFGL